MADYHHCNGHHDMQVVMSVGGGFPGCQTVVRWCRNCGSVAIDTDVDGRTNPGDVMLMKFPRITQQYARGVLPVFKASDETCNGDTK
jgi:hypothetical protein